MRDPRAERRIVLMFRKGLGLLLLFVAGVAFGVGALLVYRQVAGSKLPSLPADLSSSLDRVEEGIRGQEVRGIRAEYLAGGAMLLLLAMAWLLLRRWGPSEAPAGDRRVAERARPSRLNAWLLALVVVCLCGGGIAALYFGPETIRITESVKIQRGPRDQFLSKVLWGLLIVGGIHVVYFALFLLPRVLGGRRPPARGRSPK